MGWPTAIARSTSLDEVVQRTAPTTLHADHTVPVLEPLQPLLASRALVRGQVVAVGGTCAARSLAVALCVGAVAAGGWVAVVGMPTLGLAAAAELGVDLRRAMLIADPPPRQWSAVVAAVVGAVDVVLAEAPARLSDSDARRLSSRLRERGTSLVLVEPSGTADGAFSSGADVRLQIDHVHWHGVEQGHGHLRARRVEVRGSGRRQQARPRQLALWLPDADGIITEAGPMPSIAPVLRHPAAQGGVGRVGSGR